LEPPGAAIREATWLSEYDDDYYYYKTVASFDLGP
jgi:hypothetical protein